MNASIAQQRIGNRRLLKLAAFLTKLPPQRFNFGNWVGKDWKGAQDLSCGTTACALGWAATMPEFRRLGLELRKSRFWGNYVGLAGTRNYDSLWAAEKVFYVSEDDADWLFTPGSFMEEKRPGYFANPKQVASHIVRFVKARDRQLQSQARAKK